MRDMNFFTPIQAGKSKVKKGTFLRALTSFILFSSLAIPIVLYFYTQNINEDINEIKAVLNIPSNVAIVSELEEKGKEVVFLTTELKGLRDKDAMLQSKKWFTEELLQVVGDTLPRQVTLTEFILSMDHHGFVMQGLAIDQDAIAELEYNVRQTNRFKDIFISTIMTDDGLFSFDIEFVVKDGDGQ